jgi:hypothetical protein
MNTVISGRNREQILDELERFYESKLDAVRRKRGAHSKSVAKELIIGKPIRVRIDTDRREIVFSWKGDR